MRPRRQAPDHLPRRAAHRRAQAQAAPLAHRPRPQGPPGAADHLRGDRRPRRATATSTRSRSPGRARCAARHRPGGGQFGVDRYSIASVGRRQGPLRDAAAQGEVRRSTPARCPRSSTASPGRRRAACAPPPGAAARPPAPPTTTRATRRLARLQSRPAPRTRACNGLRGRRGGALLGGRQGRPRGDRGGGRAGHLRRPRAGATASSRTWPRARCAATPGPQVSFGTAAKVVRDLAGNVAPRTSVKAAGRRRARDRRRPHARPRRASAAGSTPSRLTWSEPVSHTADADGSYPFGVTGYGIDLGRRDSAPLLELSLNEGAAPDSGARPPVGYTRGAGAPVRDAAGNEARLARLRRCRRRRSPRGCSARARSTPTPTASSTACASSSPRPITLARSAPARADAASP